MSSSSPFAQHLHTNYVPSTMEINHLRSLVDERQKVVDALNAEIEVLVKRRDEHAKFVKEHSALLSPIRHVPNDILSLIFLACLSHNSSSRRLTRLSGDHPALVLSQVCRQWRDLALNTPLFWTIIDIQTPSFPDRRAYRWDDAMAHWERRMRAIFVMTQCWILRSANCSLTVSFSGGVSFPPRTNPSEEHVRVAGEHLRCIVDALCDVSCRWKSVYITVAMGEPGEAVGQFFQIPVEKVPLLETLYVDVLLNSPNISSQSVQIQELLAMTTGRALVQAPRLRRLGVGSLWSSPVPLPIKWTNLTELTLGPVTYQADGAFPLSALAMCVNLTKCSIFHQAPAPFQLHGAPVNPASATSTNHIRLPRLQTLELRGFEPPPSFASSVDLPSLQELVLLCSLHIPVGDGLERGATDLIRKFGDGLTDLLLDLGSLNEQDLLDVLQHVPNVVSLRITGGSMFQPRMAGGSQTVIGDSVLERLTPRSSDIVAYVDGTTCYCPKLQKFGCKVQDNVRFSEEAIIRFIAARRNRLDAGVALLTSIVVAFPAVKPAKLIRDRLQEMGVDLEDMVLMPLYMKPQSREPGVVGLTLQEHDVGAGIRDHQDYISTMGPYTQTLGGWAV